MPRTKSVGLLVAAFFLLALSTGVNVLQAQKIRSLLDPQSATSSAIGKRMGSISGFSTTGAPRQVTLRGDRPTLVYYFSPTCGWCERNWDNVQALLAGAEGRYRIVAVSSARSVREYLSARRLTDLDVIEGLDESTRKAFGFSGTPHTIVVSAEGLITHDWRGAFTPRIERQVEELFGVSLPGVAPSTR